MKTKQSGVSAGINRNLVGNSEAKTPLSGVSAGINKYLIDSIVAKKYKLNRLSIFAILCLYMCLVQALPFSHSDKKFVCKIPGQMIHWNLEYFPKNLNAEGKSNEYISPEEFSKVVNGLVWFRLGEDGIFHTSFGSAQNGRDLLQNGQADVVAWNNTYDYLKKIEGTAQLNDDGELEVSRFNFTYLPLSDEWDIKGRVLPLTPIMLDVRVNAHKVKCYPPKE